MSRRILLAVMVSLIWGALTSGVLAQGNVSTATLKGTVTDPSKAFVSGATVTARSIDRGISRQANTNGDGDYQIPLLNPGVYEVTIEAEGFRTQVTERIPLTVGQIFIHNVQLAVGQVKQRYVVATDAPLIEPERSQQSNTIERRLIENLPNFTRIFTDYIYTLPGVVNTDFGRLQNTRISPLRNSGFSIGGGNGQLNYITIDGGENEFGTGSLRIRNISVEAIQEFQVNRNSFAAEFGFTTGTAINAVTRSGGNKLHGSAYSFYTSQKLGARNPLDVNKPYEQRFFPGFTVGGPIKKNRAFFFLSYEYLKGDDTRIRSYLPSNLAALGPTRDQEAYLSKLPPELAGQLRGALTPTNFPGALEFLRTMEEPFPLPVRRHNVTTRLDYEPSGTNTFSGRFTFSLDENHLLSRDNLDSGSRGVDEDGRDYTGVGTWNRIFSEGLYNQFRMQIVKNKFEIEPLNEEISNITIAGLINTGPGIAGPVGIRQTRLQFDDTLAYTRGSHNFKFGASYRPVKLNIEAAVGFKGFFQFTGGLPVTLLLGQAGLGLPAPPAAASLTPLQSFALGLPVFYSQTFGDGEVRGTQNTLAFFEQDSWKVRRGLTIDYGLRVDYEGEPAPINRKVYVSPRFGFAYDMFGNAKTVIRGGGGLFYAPTASQVFGATGLQSDQEDKLILATRSLRDSPQSSAAIWRYGLSLGKYPTSALTEEDLRAIGFIVAPGQPGRRTAQTITNYQNPYSIQTSLGVSQLIARDLTVDVAYQFYRGVHLPIGVESNYRESGQSVVLPGTDLGGFFGPQLVPIDPTISSRTLYGSFGNSIYHGMTASVTKRFTRLAQFMANYTYSKSIDDFLDFGGGGSSTPFLPTRRFLDRGLSAFDLRHNFVANGVFDSPFKRGPGQPWYSRAFADMTVSPIIFVRSGFPFNLFLGTDVNGDLNDSDRPFLAPRNSGIGANFYSTNLRLNKRFYFQRGGNEGIRAEFIAEMTNLFNNTNFLRVNDVICGTGSLSGCDLDPKFLTGPFNFKGRRDLPRTSPLGYVTAGAARQLQFAVKLAF